MNGTLQVCLYNAEPSASAGVRAQIGALNFIRLTAEVSTPEGLPAALDGAGINLVFFHLDPDPAGILKLIEETSERFPGLALIALSHDTAPQSILAAMRAGCDQFVCEPIDCGDLAHAVSCVASKRLLHRAKSRCIALVGASGGVGTTSIACNLALEMAHVTEKKCALLDLHFQFGDVAAHFDCESKYTFHAVGNSAGDIDPTYLENILTEVPGNVAILSRPEHIEQAETIGPEQISHTISLLKTMHETVVLDVPRHIDPISFAGVTQADQVFIVCQLVVPTVRNANRYMDALAKLGVPAERIEVVINRADSTSGRITAHDLENLIKKKVFASIPNDYQFVAQSLDLGKPVAGHERSNPVRREIRRMAKAIVTEAAGDGAGTRQKRGLFGRLLAK